MKVRKTKERNGRRQDEELTENRRGVKTVRFSACPAAIRGVGKALVFFWYCETRTLARAMRHKNKPQENKRRIGKLAEVLPPCPRRTLGVPHYFTHANRLQLESGRGGIPGVRWNASPAKSPHGVAAEKFASRNAASDENLTTASSNFRPR